MICPKCGKEIVGKAHFSEPDYLGIQATVWHSWRMVKGLMGGELKQPGLDRCFLTEKEWRKINVS